MGQGLYQPNVLQPWLLLEPRTVSPTSHRCPEPEGKGTSRLSSTHLVLTYLISPSFPFMKGNEVVSASMIREL